MAQTQQELVRRFLEIKQSNLEWVWLQRLRGLSAQSTKSSLLVNRQLGYLQVIVSTAAQLAGVLTLAGGSVDRLLEPIKYSIAGHTYRRNVFRMESLHALSAIDECHGALRNDAKTVHEA